MVCLLFPLVYRVQDSVDVFKIKLIKFFSKSFSLTSNLNISCILLLIDEVIKLIVVIYAAFLFWLGQLIAVAFDFEFLTHVSFVRDFSTEESPSWLKFFFLLDSRWIVLYPLWIFFVVIICKFSRLPGLFLFLILVIKRFLTLICISVCVMGLGL